MMMTMMKIGVMVVEFSFFFAVVAAATAFIL